jgi:flagellar motility protein MotE (MotC chaperone)
MNRTRAEAFLCKVSGAALCGLSVVLGWQNAYGDSVRDEQRSKIKIRENISISEAQKYCANIANAAREARNALQRKQLADLEQKIRQRLKELEGRKNELQALVDRHEALIHKTDEVLVSVYSRMRPEAAAAQLTNLEEDTAASLLIRLRPKNASAILNERDAARAATLVKRIATLSSLPRVEKKP